MRVMQEERQENEKQFQSFLPFFVRLMGLMGPKIAADCRERYAFIIGTKFHQISITLSFDATERLWLSDSEIKRTGLILFLCF